MQNLTETSNVGGQSAFGTKEEQHDPKYLVGALIGWFWPLDQQKLGALDKRTYANSPPNHERLGVLMAVDNRRWSMKICCPKSCNFGDYSFAWSWTTFHLKTFSQEQPRHPTLERTVLLQPYQFVCTHKIQHFMQIVGRDYQLVFYHHPYRFVIDDYLAGNSSHGLSGVPTDLIHVT